MFSLAEALPSSIELDGVVYELDMSFDNVILIYDVLNDERISGASQILTCIELLFGKKIELTIEEQRDIFLTIYENYILFDSVDDTEYDIAGNPMPKMQDKESKGAIFDLKEDASYIFSSFMQDYNMDLFEQRGKLHWWKFKSLLDGLSDGTKFKKVLEIRGMELPKDSKQREQVRALKKLYALKNKEGENDGEW